MPSLDHCWVYILHCNNNTYYTGYTTDLARRYQEHLRGIASKYTRSFKPLAIAQSWKITDKKSIAMKVERFIKSLSRQKKEELILYPEMLAEYFPAVKIRKMP
jgi:putative endonuclease